MYTKRSHRPPSDGSLQFEWKSQESYSQECFWVLVLPLSCWKASLASQQVSSSTYWWHILIVRNHSELLTCISKCLWDISLSFSNSTFSKLNIFFSMLLNTLSFLVQWIMLLPTTYLVIHRKPLASSQFCSVDLSNNQAFSFLP